MREPFVIVRGAGDIATGTIYCLYKCGFKVLALEQFMTEKVPLRE